MFTMGDADGFFTVRIGHARYRRPGRSMPDSILPPL
jgi:hypothetical protein